MLDIPDAVRLAAQSLGGASLDWLNSLEDQIARLADDWGLEIGQSLSGGSGGYVVEATRIVDGLAAVLKLHMVGHEPFDHEVAVLRVAQGRGYATILDHDPVRAATLLERLGVPLSRLGLPADEQIAVICRTLQDAWRTRPVGLDLMTGAGKAELLAQMIGQMWDEQGRPCGQKVIDQALRYCGQRAQAFNPATSVLVHGDAHPGNTLQSLSDPSQFKFVDPDGLFAERACDLAVPMRDWDEAMLQGDSVAMTRARCARLSGLTGVDPDAIWQWGFMEGVSTGLYLCKLGRPELGTVMLRVAETLVGYEPS